MPEAKSHCGEGNEPAKATVPPSPAMRKPKAGHLKRIVGDCMGWGLANCHRSRQKPNSGGATPSGGNEPAKLRVKPQGVLALGCWWQSQGRANPAST